MVTGLAALVCVVALNSQWRGPLPGALLVLGGILYGVGFLPARNAWACTSQALLGSGYLIAGALLIAEPLIGALMFAFSLVALLVLLGVVQTTRALFTLHRQWIPAAACGIALAGVGVGILAMVRLPAPWLIGLVAGLALCAQGAAYLRAGRAGRRLATPLRQAGAVARSSTSAAAVWASGT